MKSMMLSSFSLNVRHPRIRCLRLVHRSEWLWCCMVLLRLGWRWECSRWYNLNLLSIQWMPPHSAYWCFEISFVVYCGEKTSLSFPELLWYFHYGLTPLNVSVLYKPTIPHSLRYCVVFFFFFWLFISVDIIAASHQPNKNRLGREVIHLPPTPTLSLQGASLSNKNGWLAQSKQLLGKWL